MKIDHYMSKLNCYSFNRKQLDILDRFSDIERKVKGMFFISFFSIVFLKTLFENTILSDMFLVFMIVINVGYFLFLIFSKRYVLRLLRKSIWDQNK